MESLYSTLISECDTLKAKISAFLRQHTKINVVPGSTRRVRSNRPVDRMMRGMPNFLPPGAFETTVVIIGSQSWAALDDAGRSAQSDLLKDFRPYKEILTEIIRGRPATTAGEIEASITEVGEIIGQSGCLAQETVGEVTSAVCAELDKQMRLLGAFANKSDGLPILVADTNALYHNPALETWAFGEIPEFHLAVLTPVLEELDRHKEDSRNVERQKKAQRIIKQIKEYRRRGDIQRGVPLRREVSTFIAPVVDRPQSLPLLNPEVADNRILMGCFELARQRLGCPVVLVTKDVNLQNLADYLRLPYCEPPAPNPGNS